MRDAAVTQLFLPERFRSLDDLLDTWALPTEHERRERRATSAMSDLRAFHERVGPLILDMAAYLDGFPMGPTLPGSELRLLQLAQMYMEVAWAVEVIEHPEEPDQVPRERWKISPIKRQQFTASAEENTQTRGAS